MASRLSVASPIGSGDQNELKEIHVKMSKKIAQLTKGKNHNIFFQIILIKNYRKIMFRSVIYQLNTKNEDNDQKIKYLTETHAKQIEDLKTSSIKNSSSPPEDSIELSKVLLNFTGLIASNNHQIISLIS